MYYNILSPIDEIYDNGHNFGIYFYLESHKDNIELKSQYFYNIESRPMTQKECKNFKRNINKIKKFISKKDK